ncbi:hypothetical protein Cgig2_026159 [Carnegiea gigantea]|uniref:Uncharacterized protein n=1 Tax=Carnegiea gigantea TaxID=171969 RepID=A0A9Q1JPH4_9CARY|nr:hypothetical protein Cgig2_026159 [Carnegiea gigantea]
MQKMIDLMNVNPGEIVVLGCGFCVMLSMYFAIQLLSQHLFFWKNPKEQKAIIIIILMAPIYAVVSFVGLLDVRGSEAFFMFLESIKECYEALGIVLEILAAVGIIRSQYSWLDVRHIEEGIQNLLVCLEMVIFSVLQQYAYSAAPYSGDVSKWKTKKNE